MDDKILRQQSQKLLKRKDKIYSKCEICDKVFKNNNGLKKHSYIVHNYVKEHQCNICQRYFKIHSKLTSHVKIVHENRKHLNLLGPNHLLP